MGAASLYAGRKLIQLVGTYGVVKGSHEAEEPLTPEMRLLYIFICTMLVVLAGLMSGLTLGLLSLDKVDTEVIKRSGTPKQRWLVERIEPVLAHPHFLLVTLLLMNAVAMEALPIFLDRLLNPVAAVLISVTAILLFGEIIPQAVCKRYGLEIGAYLAWLVRLLMFLTAPVSYPIAKLLDWILGEENALFRRAELKALVSFHAEPQDDGGVSTLTQDEVNVIQGALDMANKTAEAAMTPLDKVFMLSSEAVINDELLKQAIDRGHSRVPVYEGSRQNIIGLILVKELVLVDEDAGIKVKDLRLREMPFLRADIPMYDVLKIFRTGRSHMAVLTRDDGQSRPRTSLEEEGAGLLSAQPSTASVPAMGGAAAAGGASAAAAGGASPPAPPMRTSSFGRRPSLGMEHGLPSAARLWASQEAIGIITIEDVLEELLQAEIVDETDRYVDNLQTVRTTTLLSLQHLPPNLRKFLTRTFRASSPINRAAFQAALAAQNPFAMSPPGTAPQPAAAGEAGGAGAGAPAALMSPQKPLAVAAAMVTAAAAAAYAEDLSTHGGQGALMPLLDGPPPLGQPPQQQRQQAAAAAAQQQQGLTRRPSGSLPPSREISAIDEDTPLLGPQPAAPQGGGRSAMSSPFKPPLPKLRVRTSPQQPPPLIAKPLLDGVCDSGSEASPGHGSGHGHGS